MKTTIEQIKEKSIQRFKDLSKLHLTSKPGRRHDKWLSRADEVERSLTRYFGLTQADTDLIYEVVRLEVEEDNKKHSQD